MAKQPKPWWRKQTQCYYVRIDGVQHRLDPDKGKADKLFYALMARPKEEALQADLAIVAIDRYLVWCETNRPDSYDWYYQFLNPFCKVVQKLRIDQVQPHHVETFISKPTWGSSAKRAAITAIKRAFNWNVKQGYINQSPVRHVEKPEATPREQIVTEEQHKDILGRVSKPFAELLELAWETGARPFELYRLETRHLDLKNSRAVYPKAESKGKKKQRVLLFSDKALEIIKRNMGAAGPVMRNADGAAWTAFSINCCFLRLQTAMGKEKAGKYTPSDAAIVKKAKEIEKGRKEKGKEALSKAALNAQAKKSLKDVHSRKEAPKYCLYLWRHGFAHRKLSEGVDSMIVAQWMGHSSTAMLEKVYAHLHKNQDFLLAQLNK